MRSFTLVAILGLIGLTLPERQPPGTWSARLVGSDARCGIVQLQVRETSTHLLLLDAAGRESLLSLPRAEDGSGTSSIFWRRLRSGVDVAIGPGAGPRAMHLSVDASQCQFHTPSR